METPQDAKVIEAVWPDKTLEKVMLVDVAALEHAADWEYGDSNLWMDVCCHIKALLCRVRELEQELQRKEHSCPTEPK